jgi:hypothetical protein
MCCLHPIDPVKPELAETCLAHPRCSREHVYLFFVHGMDPFDYANLEGVRDYVQSLGFCKTYYGQLYHTSQFEQVIQRVHREDAEARFVLVGFSFGANMVRNIAQAVGQDDVWIDLIVYLGGNTLKDEPRDQPDNVGRIVNILAQGCIWNGDTMQRAENIQVKGVWHFGSPTHPYTLELLARELAVVASHVPVVQRPEPPPWEETAPTPRPLSQRKAAAPREEWNFLKPVSRLSDGAIRATGPTLSERIPGPAAAALPEK